MPIGQFASALTRVLLAGDGSTTLLLQALTGGPVKASLRSLSHQPAAHLPAGPRALLGLADGATAIVRRSLLLDQRDTPVSRNEVIAFSDDALLRRVVSDPVRPVGLGLIAHDIDHSRRLHATGLTRWDATGLEAASKVYLIRAAATPFMLVWETFNPALIPSGITT
ncbi:hypothetical protein [Nonomuraea rosea]|uniref:hypothetical protein n=1 Tax=Nonomuraea rosea TaxID=638574 RepID=UPI0031E6E3E2